MFKIFFTIYKHLGRVEILNSCHYFFINKILQIFSTSNDPFPNRNWDQYNINHQKMVNRSSKNPLCFIKSSNIFPIANDKNSIILKNRYEHSSPLLQHWYQKCSKRNKNWSIPLHIYKYDQKLCDQANY